jgi:hypothetical protein
MPQKVASKNPGKVKYFFCPWPAIELRRRGGLAVHFFALKTPPFDPLLGRFSQTRPSMGARVFFRAPARLNWSPLLLFDN